MPKIRPGHYRVRFICNDGEKTATIAAPHRIGYGLADMVALKALVEGQTGALSVVLLHWEEITDINQEGARAGLMNQPEEAFLFGAPCPSLLAKPKCPRNPAGPTSCQTEE